jgi:hypothetical protein
MLIPMRETVRHAYGRWHDQRRASTPSRTNRLARGAPQDRCRAASPITTLCHNARPCVRATASVPARSTRSSPIRPVAQAAMKRPGRSCTRHPQHAPASASSGSPCLFAHTTTMHLCHPSKGADPASRQPSRLLHARPHAAASCHSSPPCAQDALLLPARCPDASPSAAPGPRPQQGMQTRHRRAVAVAAFLGTSQARRALSSAAPASADHMWLFTDRMRTCTHFTRLSLFQRQRRLMHYLPPFLPVDHLAFDRRMWYSSCWSILAFLVFF